MRPPRFQLALTGAAALVFLLSGCGSSTSDSATDTPAATTSAADTSAADTSAATDPGTAAATITIKDFAYGDPITVAPGTTVTVINMDDAPHNANAKDGSFSEPLMGKGESSTFVAPSTPGTYDLICTMHGQMSGQLIVSG